MRTWDEVATYFQGFSREQRYGVFVYDMQIAVNILRDHQIIGQLPRDIGAGVIVFLLPNAALQPTLGWFKPKVYSAANRDVDGKFHDAQFITINGLIGTLEQLIGKASTPPSVSSSPSVSS
jgi:hypothetical protein